MEDDLYARLSLHYFGHHGHIYSFSLTNIRKLLTLSGFSEIKFVYHLARIGYRTWWNNRFNQWANAYLPGWLSYHMSAAYWVLARKREDYEQIKDRVSGVLR